MLSLKRPKSVVKAEAAECGSSRLSDGARPPSIPFSLLLPLISFVLLLIVWVLRRGSILASLLMAFTDLLMFEGALKRGETKWEKTLLRILFR